MAEEIVRVIKVDTRNSGKSIKDLRNEIKSLRGELDKAVVGSEEFESTLRKLTQTQRSYNEIQQQVRDLSRTNQQNMVNFAKFASNLGKSYSALNAAVGLFADKNEDVQKAMLKVQRTIQLIQGLDGITGLLRDLPKIGAAFKSWFSFLDPIERKITNIIKGINGADPSKLRGINEAGRQGGSTSSSTATAGGTPQQINQQTQAIQQQTRVITALNAARKEETAKLKELQNHLNTQTQKYNETSKAAIGLMQVINKSGMSVEDLTAKIEANDRMIKNLTLTANLGNKQSQERIALLKQENIELVKKKAELEVLTAATKMYANSAIEAGKNQAILNQQIAASEKRLKTYEVALNAASAGMSKLWTAMKTIGKTVGWTLVISAAITLVLKLLESMGLTIDGFWDWVTGANSAAEAQRKLNKEISEGTNQAASKQIVILKELSIAYGKLGDSVDKKKEFLEKYSEKIKETGLSVNDLKTAEDVFINNTDNYINAIVARAKAQATENAAIKLYQDYLNERYDLEQKFTKRKNKDAGTNSKEEYITLLKGMGMTAEQAEEAWNTATTKRQKKILDQINKADKEVQDRLKQMFEDVAELEQQYAGFFGSATTKTTQTGPSTDWDKEYKEALEALRGYIQDYLDIFKDARTRELDENRRAYEENVKNINLNFLKGVEAAQGNAKKLLEVEEEKNKALHFAQLAYERQRLDIINKYNDEVFEKQKAELDREYQLLEKQLERNRRLYDTSNLREPKQISYQTTYNQNPLPLGLGRNWMSVYQSKDDVERQYKDQVAYNNRILELTQIRINKENELLNEEINTLTNKAKVLQEQLNSTDLNDLDRRREIVDQLADIDDTLFTNKQTLAQNEIALDNAVLDNEEANLDAYLDMQDKKKQALDGVLDVVSNASGALASMFRMEANNDKKSEEQRKRALKAYKAFAITQAIADTWKGANEAYAAMASIPYVGPALGIAASAAAVIAGLANVKAIMSESISSSSQGASVNAPAPMQTAPIEYTRNLVGDKELDEINQPVRCYVLESDISKTQNKVKVTEQNATF